MNGDTATLFRRWKRARLLLLLAPVAVIAWTCWKGLHDPAIPLLPPGGAEWIVYPSPPEGDIYPGRAISADFARSFVLTVPPSRAEISWRGFREAHLSINGKTVTPLPSDANNWKKVRRCDALPYLRAGTNNVTATVANDNGPPALSLRLDIDGVSVKTDPAWSASLAGSLWRPARLASATPEFGAGNELDGLEKTGKALRDSWRVEFIFLIAALLVALAVERRLKKIFFESRHWVWLALGLAAVWLLLFLHNATLLPYGVGFDASDHVNYISYIQKHWALPSPRQGWEMFQSPLFYALSACLLGHANPATPTGILIVRGLNMVVGVANIALIFACLRLMFPGEWKNPLAGALLAAFVPAQIYLLHYPTNETLSATLMTAAFYICLRILGRPGASVALHAVLGSVLGLALLTKASAVVFLPIIFVAIAGKLILEHRTAPAMWVRTIGAAALFLLLVAGWRYAEVWRDFGNPLVGNWDPRVTAPWWQQPGYHTARYFFTFGRAFTAPLFSGFHSFWDCFYTTLWGDGLCGGSASTTSLPPWNYSLMETGFVLALAPTGLVLTGVVMAVERLWRKPDLVTFFIAGAGGSALFAIVYMSLKLPFYSQSKCFYGLPALLPFCVFGVYGWDYWSRRGAGFRVVGGALLLVWLCTVYCSFWVRPSAEQTELYRARADFSSGTNDQSWMPR
jgi:hypothetical protein